MEDDDLPVKNLRRKRRRIGGNRDEPEQEHKPPAKEAVPRPPDPSYDFLNLFFLIADEDIPILFPSAQRPRNAYELRASGGSFLVFNDDRAAEDMSALPEKMWKAETDKFVLKRTRGTLGKGDKDNSLRYTPIMAELQVFINKQVRKNENIIDFLGLTFDFEPEEDGSWSPWPVLVLEAADCTLTAVLQEGFEESFPIRLIYCYEVTKGLEFLHKCGVVHCDIKTENILICSAQSSPWGSIAKISDFGSAVLGVSADTYLRHGVAGTRPWNAPEWSSPLRGLDIYKVDVYSLAMLLWRMLSPSSFLEDLVDSSKPGRDNRLAAFEETKASDQVSSLAVKDLASKEMPSGVVIADSENSFGIVIGQINELLTHALCKKPEDRWDMSVVMFRIASLVPDSSKEEEILDNEEELTLGIEAEANGNTKDNEAASVISDVETSSLGAEDDDMRIETVPLVAPFEDFEIFYETINSEESYIIKERLFSSLQKWIHSHQRSNTSNALGNLAAALYQLAQCYVNGFGVLPDYGEGFRLLIQAADLGHRKAKAEAPRIALVFEEGNRHLLLPEASGGWLSSAVAAGNFQLLDFLKQLDHAEAAEAMNRWRRKFCLATCDSKAPSPYYPTHAWLTKKANEWSVEKIDRKAVNDHLQSILHVAASTNCVEAVRTMVERGVDINVQNRYGEDALLCACRAGNASIAELLLNAGCEINYAQSAETPLHWLIAFKNDDVERIARALIECNVDIEASCLVIEMEYEDTFIIDIPEGTALAWAVWANKASAVKALINLGANPFSKCWDESVISFATRYHKSQILEFLLESNEVTKERINRYEDGRSLLASAIGCSQEYNRLVAHGQRTGDEAIKTITLLIDYGSDPSRIDSDGTNIIHLAAAVCDRSFLEMILRTFPSFKAYINMADDSGYIRPLHSAIASGRLDSIQVLVSNGADVHCTRNGSTLLHSLAARQNEKYGLACIKLLNIRDLSVLNRTNDFGEDFPCTAFEIAVTLGNLEIAEYLRSCGAATEAPSAKNRKLNFFYMLILSGDWYSVASLRFYIDKVQPGFVVDLETGLTALHVAASRQVNREDPATAEMKLEVLLSAFSKSELVNARTSANFEFPGEAGDTAVTLGWAAGGQTPLHHAAMYGVYYATKRLLEAGADLNAKDFKGRTAIDLARLSAEEVLRRGKLEETGNTNVEVSKVTQDILDTRSLLESIAKGSPLLSFKRQVLPSRQDISSMGFTKLGFRTENQ